MLALGAGDLNGRGVWGARGKGRSVGKIPEGGGGQEGEIKKKGALYRVHEA